MGNTIKDLKKWELFEVSSKDRRKLIGTPAPGKKVKLFWHGWGNKIHDEGYLFQIKECDDYVESFFIHVPNPQNPEGIGDVEPEFHHINELLSNTYLTKIVVERGG